MWVKAAGRAIRTNIRESRKRRVLLRSFARQSPGLRQAIAGDVRITLLHRSERYDITDPMDLLAQIVRLSTTSDAFLAQLIYRVRVELRRKGVPLLPGLAHHLSIVLGGVAIGDPVVIAPGLYLPHGQVVVDGVTTIGSNVIVAPWTTIGLRAGSWHGPRIQDRVQIGTGARVLGDFTVGRRASIGANAVVVRDVPADSVVSGVPARPHEPRETESRIPEPGHKRAVSASDPGRGPSD